MRVHADGVRCEVVVHGAPASLSRAHALAAHSRIFGWLVGPTADGNMLARVMLCAKAAAGACHASLPPVLLCVCGQWCPVVSGVPEPARRLVSPCAQLLRCESMPSCCDCCACARLAGSRRLMQTWWLVAGAMGAGLVVCLGYHGYHAVHAASPGSASRCACSLAALSHSRAFLAHRLEASCAGGSG